MLAVDDVLAPFIIAERRDMLGGFRAWLGTDEFIECVYFSSEAEARAGEAKRLPEPIQAAVHAIESTIPPTIYYDLVSPNMRSRQLRRKR
ncbi:MAG: hypothetical protein ABI658_27865 [Acidimicrobiales bacterium]